MDKKMDDGSNSKSQGYVLVSAEEFVRFCQYQKSLKESASITTLVESGETCLVTY